MYVHGYDPLAGQRLKDQASTLVDLLHSDTAYPAGCVVLEAGCGVGAQTVTLALRSPDARFTSVDISAASVAQAKRKVEQAGAINVQFHQGTSSRCLLPPSPSTMSLPALSWSICPGRSSPWWLCVSCSGRAAPSLSSRNRSVVAPIATLGPT